MLGWVNGEFKPVEEINVNVRSKALNYGIGCFGGVRAYWNDRKKQLYIFRPFDHVRRLLNSMKILFMETSFSDRDLVETIKELLRKNNQREAIYIRPIAFNNAETISPTFDPKATVLAIYLIPLGRYLGDIEKGVRAMVTGWSRVSDNALPPRLKATAAYLNSALARQQAKICGFDEAIFLTDLGFVCEGTAESIFLVKDGKISAPGLYDDNLDSITRRTLAILFEKELKMPLEFRHVNHTELYLADELIFCGTGAEVTPVVNVDGYTVGTGKTGPVTRKLAELFHQIVHGDHELSRDWCEPVW